MAKRTIRQNKSEEKKTSFIEISSEKKKKIIGFVLVIFSLLLFLSIVSYARSDKALLTYSLGDLFGFGSSDNISKELNKTTNWLGIIGAYVSDFFINSTFGFFSLIFPFIIGMWGYNFFHKFETKKLLQLTNFLIISALLLSAFLGLLRLEYNLFYSSYELSGAIGDLISESISLLIGRLGALILLLSLILITLVIAFDLKIEKIFQLFQKLFSSSVEFAKEKVDATKEKIDETKSSNLDKIKKLRQENIKEAPAKVDNSENEIKNKDTKIQIIRKDEISANKKKNQKSALSDSELNDAEQKLDGNENSEDAASKDEVSVNRELEVDKPEQWQENIAYKMPPIDLLTDPEIEDVKVADEELKRNAELLKDKLKLFDIDINDIKVTPGPVLTLYEIVPAPGVKISQIVSLENDIALALAARGIRIIAPIPGKSAIGVEIPNSHASTVVAKSIIENSIKSEYELPLALGKDISGESYVTDLAKMPHLLIAGSTGSGKSVGINMIIASLLYAKKPSEVKFALIDPKKIELSFYNDLRKHYLCVSPDILEEIVTIPTNAVLLLKSVEMEMENRYDKFVKAGVRHIVDYNLKIKDPIKKPKETPGMRHHHLPYIVVIIDELADLMITAGKEVEEPIARLAQLARAVGIHLVLATQRPSVNVITGVIKANFSARMAYQVATKIDSRTILDMNGAEQLLGRGDMLFLPSGLPKPIRIQNAFISTDEVEKLTKYVFDQPSFSKPYYLPSIYDKKKETSQTSYSDFDPLFEDAARVVVRHQQGSVSLLQRRLKLGYSRAARIVDQLEEAGIVGPNDGSKAREVIIDSEEQLETVLRALRGS